MKITYLCLRHPPKDGRVYHKISKALKMHGHELINLHPNIEDIVTEDDIHLIGYPQTGGIWGRLQSFQQLRLTAIKTNPDIVIAAEPDSLYAAQGIKKIQKKVKVIFDCHEWYGEHFNIRLKSVLLKKIIRRIIPWWINGMVKRCDAVISVNNAMAKYYARYNPQSYTIPSIADVVFLPDMNVPRNDFMYFGQFGTCEQENILLDTAKILKNKCCNARIVVVGGSHEPDKFRMRTAEMDVANNIIILDWLPREKAFIKLNEGCAGIMRFDMQNYRGYPALPNKIFEYMAAGMAVIGCRINPEIAAIIDNEKCGIAIENETAEALADAIIYLHKNPQVCRQMGLNAHYAVQKTFNWKNYGKLLDDIITEVAQNKLK